jgi:hypothetical protein
MMYLLLSVVVLGIALLVALVHSWHRQPLNERPRTTIDLEAFKNILSPDDDAFLRRNLPPFAYRTAKRLQTRAIQEYLRCIAADCSAIQSLVKSSRVGNEQKARVQSLIVMTARLRFVALLTWCGLWIQWVFPTLNLMPGSILAVYETFAEERRVLFSSLGQVVN